eukprot:TRINITY_DN3949_c0_g1_i1.p1 TRINITY_DN3949_c0_g1~~TRINITY_DN3949_c0_g1_i1.p1  ORF type:complete len:640 (-),score=81.23 TRINITY_DN3949_c0_g1_i1:223-2142(-)
MMDFTQLRTLVDRGGDVTKLQEWARQPSADIHQVDAEYMSTLLHWACGNGNEAAAEVLLKQQADPNFRNKFGATPLHWACHDSHESVVKVLLQYGVDSTIKDNNNETALDIAKQKSATAIINLLTSAEKLAEQDQQEAVMTAISPTLADKPVHSAFLPQVSTQGTASTADKDLQVENARLRKIVQELTDEVMRCQKALTDHVEYSMTDRTKETDALKSIVSGLEQQNKELTEENSSIKTKQEHNEAVITVFREEKEIASKKLDQLLKEDEDRLRAVETEAKASLEAMEGRYKVELSKMQTRMEDMSQTVYNLREIERDRDTAKAQLVLLVDERSGLQMQIQSLQSQLKNLQNAQGNQSPKGQDGAGGKLSEEAAKLQLENYELREQLKVMDDLRYTVMKMHKEKLQTEVGNKVLSELHAKVDSLETENAQLKEQLNTIRNKKGLLDDDNSPLSHLSDSKETPEMEEMRKTKMKLELEIEELAALQEEVNILRKTKAALEAETTVMVELQTKVNELSKENNDLRIAVISKDRTLKEMQNPTAAPIIHSTKKFHQPAPPVPRKPVSLPPMPTFPRETPSPSYHTQPRFPAHPLDVASSLPNTPQKGPARAESPAVNYFKTMLEWADAQNQHAADVGNTARQ